MNNNRVDGRLSDYSQLQYFSFHRTFSTGGTMVIQILHRYAMLLVSYLPSS